MVRGFFCASAVLMSVFYMQTVFSPPRDDAMASIDARDECFAEPWDRPIVLWNLLYILGMVVVSTLIPSLLTPGPSHHVLPMEIMDFTTTPHGPLRV